MGKTIFSKALPLLLAAMLCMPLLALSQRSLEKTEVLILGTPHLFSMEKFKPSMLDGVKEKLNSYDFDIICVEKMPGQLLYDISRRKDTAFNGLTRMQKHIKLADSVQSYLGGDFLASKAKTRELTSRELLTNKDRKDLLYHFVATTNIPAAVLQYKYLQQSPDVFTTEMDRYVSDFLKKRLSGNNEYFSLAVPLAFKKKLNTIEPIDNMQDMALLSKYYPSFVTDFKTHPEIIEKVMNSEVLKKSDSLTKEAVASNDLSKLYEFLNSEEYMEEDYDAQWKIWFETNFPSKSDMARYSLWEMRNLQISANIMDVVARYPNKRILVIIGSSHKSFLEKYLKQIESLNLLSY
ncbi:DUF5694 domain-containing protein [Marinirhabdus gelatinilytica]|uniref:TraB family protein n=1 Tax=Marinirhabdus gelatinilytica TaxID=1703343 RepID=A0A370Q927_9FLAO|nr:DUF5694 domain-containing protein [Marinirhabdus gelatinilytica]RDK84858.1 hypothetical protein C8D94_104233 [Marinirhabdus gelatinilytica]